MYSFDMKFLFAVCSWIRST